MDRYADILSPVHEEDRMTVRVYANGTCNMTGGRYRDALESEVRAYRRQGRAEYLRSQDEYRRNSSFYPRYGS